jgi:hypothetical protein
LRFSRDLAPLTDAEVAQMDRANANGLSSLMRVDRFVGSASDLLRNKGEMDNTYFVFYADSRNHFGQQRLAPGKLQPYENDVNFDNGAIGSTQSREREVRNLAPTVS